VQFVNTLFAVAAGLFLVAFAVQTVETASFSAETNVYILHERMKRIE